MHDYWDGSVMRRRLEPPVGVLEGGIMTHDEVALIDSWRRRGRRDLIACYAWYIDRRVWSEGVDVSRIADACRRALDNDGDPAAPAAQFS